MESFDSHWRAKNIEGAASRCPDDEILPVLLRHARPGARILESGCGSGAWVLFLRGRGYDVTGLDWSPETVLAAATDPERGDEALDAAEASAWYTSRPPCPTPSSSKGSSSTASMA